MSETAVEVLVLVPKESAQRALRRVKECLAWYLF